MLRDDPEVIRVLVFGEESRRAERLARETGDSVDAALRIVRRSDVDQHDLYERAYSVDPFSPVMYDLTVNSDRSPVEAAIEAILAAVGQLAETTSP